ncbi:MAG: hypothetical protein ACLTW9_03380 [Enterocloster sp.]
MSRYVDNQCFMTMNSSGSRRGESSRTCQPAMMGNQCFSERLPPELGENTIELLKEAGYSDSQIQEMMKQGKAVSPEKKQDKQNRIKQKENLIMKKIAVLLTTVLTAGMLAACGQGKNAWKPLQQEFQM